MTQEDLDEFAGALEGGKFLQGTGKLRYKELGEVDAKWLPWNYCCLGLLSHLQKDKVGLVSDERPHQTFYRRPDTTLADGHNTNLHPVLMGRFGCGESGFLIPVTDLTEAEKKQCSVDTHPDGEIDTHVSAMSLNDSGIPFPRIAELARKNIKVIDNYEDRNVIFDPLAKPSAPAA